MHSPHTPGSPKPWPITPAGSIIDMLPRLAVGTPVVPNTPTPTDESPHTPTEIGFPISSTGSWPLLAGSNPTTPVILSSFCKKGRHTFARGKYTWSTFERSHAPHSRRKRSSPERPFHFSGNLLARSFMLIVFRMFFRPGVGQITPTQRKLSWTRERAPASNESKQQEVLENS